MNDRLDKLEKVSLNREIENIPSKYDILQHEQTIKKLLLDIESLKTE